MEKISFEDFMATYPKLEDQDSETIEIWKNRHKFRFIEQMSDVWGEADKCVKLKNSNKTDALDKQIAVFVNVVDSVLTDPKLTAGAKEELRSAEWELLDYCIWDNEWKNKDKTAMGWFDQWMFSYSYALR